MIADKAGRGLAPARDSAERYKYEFRDASCRYMYEYSYRSGRSRVEQSGDCTGIAFPQRVVMQGREPLPRLIPTGRLVTLLGWYTLVAVVLGPLAAADLGLDDDGSHEARITSPQEISDAPAWAPDGRRVLFGRLSGVHGIYIVNPDGTDLTQLTAPPPNWDDAGARWIKARVWSTESWRCAARRCGLGMALCRKTTVSRQ